MKRICYLLLLLTATIAGQARNERKELLLNDAWTIRPISDPTPTAKSVAVTLPHTWNATYTKGTHYNRETMVYSRTLAVTPQMAEGRLFLYFEGVNSVADVFVNRKTIGQHKGGYTAFCLEITDHVHIGDNTIEVWAGNAFRTDVLPISGDFNVYGGIHRPVHLIVTGKDCISPLFYGSPGVLVHQNKANEAQAAITVETILSLKSGKQGLSLYAQVTDMQGRLVASGEAAANSDCVSLPMTITKPILWHGRQNPYLYNVKVELKDGEHVLDSQTVQTGLRYFSVDGEKGFFLNGQSYPLRGFNRHEDVDGKGSALTTEDHELDMQLISETGATFIRLSHYPQSSCFYDLADRQGMVLWSEIPLVGPGGYDFTGYVKNVEENARQVALEMIYQNYNHPSVCFWGLFNELLVDEGRFREWDYPVDFIRSLNTLVKEADSSRLTTFATCVSHAHYLGCSDLLAWNKYFRKPGNESKVRQFYEEARQTTAGQPLGISEYGDAGSINIHYDPRYDRVRDHAENYQLLTHEGYWKAIKDMDWLWCKTIWQLSDMQSSIRHEGDRDGVNDKGMVTSDRKTRKDIYYFYKAQWNPEPMAYITGRRFVNRKHDLTDVKVYTNQKEAILYVNGRKIGKAKADDIHRIVFKDVQLSEGENHIMVRAGKVMDECSWTLKTTDREPMAHYLFAYFNNNTTEGQQVCYAVSGDGVNFIPLNDGRPVIASDSISRSGGVRDPHILRGSDGWFYQVLTDMDMSKGKWTCQGVVLLRSRDLIHWQHHTVHFPERYQGTPFANVNAVWAPQTIFDPSVKKLMVYFSLHSEKDGPFPQDAVYYAYANGDFSNLEGEPQPLFTYPHPTIDTDIVQDSTGLYHLFFNTWGGPDGLQRRQYEFRDLHNQKSWTLVSGHQQPTKLNSEGSTCYQLLDGTWILSYDCFKDGVYQFCRTKDFRDYELVHETKTEGKFTPRHGGIIQITEMEYQLLLKTYGRNKY